MSEDSEDEWVESVDPNPPRRFGPKGFERPVFNSGQASSMIGHMAGSLERIADALEEMNRRNNG